MKILLKIDTKTGKNYPYGLKIKQNPVKRYRVLLWKEKSEVKFPAGQIGHSVA